MVDGFQNSASEDGNIMQKNEMEVWSMQATDLLKEEHHGVKIALRSLEKVGAKLEEAAGAEETPYADDMGRLIEFLRVFVDKCHHAKEEDVLFPALVEDGEPIENDLVKVLLAEHAAGRKLVSEMTEALTSYQAGNRDSVSDLRGAARSYTQLLTDHIAKEDSELYPLADIKISAAAQQEMVEVFEKIEIERIGMGTHEKFHAMLGEFKQKYLNK